MAVAPSSACLEDRFEVLKDIGDGSFGTVVLARVRSQASHIARKNSIVSLEICSRRAESL
jgi:meiosis induction protein kinase IME2/SME1